jgi:hypothetical protein
MPDATDSLRSAEGFTLRKANEEDLDIITQIVKVSFAREPEQNYRFPHRDKYPEDYRIWTRKEYQGYLEQPEKFVFHVVEASVKSNVTVKRQPIALSVWDVAVNIASKVGA